jgi:two-component system chemotaxis response regulator CheB
MPHTVLVADDSEMMRRSIRKLLDEEPSVKIIGEADDFANAISMARDLQPDVISG